MVCRYILRSADGQVTFRYTDNKGTHKTRTPSPPASGYSRPRGALGSKSGAFDAIPANNGRMEPCSGS